MYSSTVVKPLLFSSIRLPFRAPSNLLAPALTEHRRQRLPLPSQDTGRGFGPPAPTLLFHRHAPKWNQPQLSTSALIAARISGHSTESGSISSKCPVPGSASSVASSPAARAAS